MTESAPIYCRPRAFELFAAQMPFLNERRGLLKAAVAISIHEHEDVEPTMVDQELEAIAQRVRDRAPSGQPSALLAHLHDILFDEMELQGNEADYYNPDNSYLPCVLETRMGIPITLALLYADVAGRLGFNVEGVNAPGHFLVALVEEDDRWTLVDPYFRGRIMTRDEALSRIAKIVPGSAGDHSHLLAVATHRQWVMRMLRNLMGVFQHQGKDDDAAAMAELAALL